jgi:hypothetical protein
MGWEENGRENHLNELFSVSEAGRKLPFYFSSSLLFSSKALHAAIVF